MKVNWQTAAVTLVVAGVAIAAQKWGGDSLAQVATLAAVALASLLKQLVESPNAP